MVRHRSIQVVLASVLGVALFFVGATAAEAGPKDPGLPGSHLTVEAVEIDFDPMVSTFGQLTITGQHFEFGNPLAVSLGPSAQSPSDLIMVSTSDTVLLYDLPKAFPNGDYLLRVSTGNGQSQNDEYDLTIGAVGPPGVTELVFYESERGDVTIPEGSASGSVSISCDSGDTALGLANYEMANLVELPQNPNVSGWGWTRTASDTISVSVRLWSTCDASIGCYRASARVLCLDTTP
jgi:hypothetical protein